MLSNTQTLLSSMIEDSDSPFIFEKIGTQLENIMIDEFQDTSTVQWENFKVLLKETMSREGKNLIVGDVKNRAFIDGVLAIGDFLMILISNSMRGRFQSATGHQLPFIKECCMV